MTPSARALLTSLYPRVAERLARSEMAYMSSAPSKPMPFMKFPPEIRDNIYRLSLVTGKEVVMYPEPHEMDDLPNFGRSRPCVELLQVNKQVHEEASPVFYGENMFRLPVKAEHHAVFIKYRALIHHASLRLDWKEVTDQQKISIATVEHCTPDAAFARARPRAARWRHIHKRHLQLMIGQWAPRRQLVVEDLPFLKTIKLDLKKFHCPGTCCRIEPFQHHLYHCFVKHLPLSFTTNGNKIEVSGLKTDDERAVVSERNWARFAKLA